MSFIQFRLIIQQPILPEKDQQWHLLHNVLASYIQWVVAFPSSLENQQIKSEPSGQNSRCALSGERHFVCNTMEGHQTFRSYSNMFQTTEGNSCPFSSVLVTFSCSPGSKSLFLSQLLPSHLSLLRCLGWMACFPVPGKNQPIVYVFFLMLLCSSQESHGQFLMLCDTHILNSLISRNSQCVF